MQNEKILTKSAGSPWHGLKSRPFLSTSIFLFLALLLSLAIGSVFLSPRELWNTLIGQGSDTASSILWKIRLPRTILIALTGAALGGSGATYRMDMRMKMDVLTLIMMETGYRIR